MKLFFRIRNLFPILLCCGFILYNTACIKEKKEQPTDEAGQYSALSSEYALSIPINLDAYNILKSPDTKAGQDTTFICQTDSLIDWNKALQTSTPDGIVYTQVPFKTNDSILHAAISSSPTPHPDSIVPVKSFLIIFENGRKNLHAEYIATIIPSKVQTKYRPDFDFLDKPNFSGIILYAKKDGTYLGNEVFKNGLICQGELLYCQTDSIETLYIAFFQKIKTSLTKTSDNEKVAWEDRLTKIVITAVRDPLPKTPQQYPDNTRDPIEQMHSDKQSPIIGGGGPTPGDTSTRKWLTSVATGCLSAGGSNQTSTLYTKDSEVEITAQVKSDSCLFLCWTENTCIVGNSPRLMVKMDKDRTVTAHYASKDNTDCYKLAKLAADSALMKIIEQLRQKIGPENIEYSVMQRANGTYYQTQGVEGKVETPLETGMKYTYRFHTHTYDKQNIFTSAKDLLSLRTILISGAATDVSHFFYGTITNEKTLGLYVYDFNKFKNYFEAITTDKDELRNKFIDHYNNMFANKIKILSMEELLPIYTELLNSMGIKLVIGNSFPNIYNNMSINWKAMQITSENNFNINQCFTK